MISKDELMALAGETGLRPNIVEKDYVLGWVLAGIFNHTEADPTVLPFEDHAISMQYSPIKAHTKIRNNKHKTSDPTLKY